MELLTQLSNHAPFKKHPQIKKKRSWINFFMVKRVPAEESACAGKRSFDLFGGSLGGGPEKPPRLKFMSSDPKKRIKSLFFPFLPPRGRGGPLFLGFCHFLPLFATFCHFLGLFGYFGGALIHLRNWGPT